MTDSEKSQDIVNKNFEWISNLVEENNLSKEDRNKIRFKMYSACQEMAEWKERQMIEKACEFIAEWFWEHPHAQIVCSDEFESIDELLDRIEKAMKGGEE